MSPKRHPSLALFLAVLVTIWSGSGALASDGRGERYYFKVGQRALTSALIDFAEQARSSLSIQGVGKCRSMSNALTGHFGLGEGLTRLLNGTGCDFRLLGNGAILVFARVQPVAVPTPRATKAIPTPAGPVQPVVVQELLVTSGHRPAVLDRAPYSVSRLSGDDISQSGAVDLGGLAALVGGATFTDLGPGRDKIFLRGLADSVVAGRTQSTVGLYLDGSRISYNAPDPDLRLTDVDRIEVLRGPQGALYGAGSIGGVFEIVTHRPELDAYSAEIGVEGAATVGGAPSGAIDAVLNLPLVNDRLGLRLVAYDEVQGGYLNNPVLGLKNVNRVDRRGFRVAARWQANPDWSVTANVVRQSLSVADGQYANPIVGERSRDTLIQEPQGDEFTAFGLSITGRRPWGDIAETTSVVRQTQTSRFDATLALPFFEGPVDAGPSPFDQSDTSEIIVNEVSLTSPQAGRIRWLGGLFQSLTDNESTSALMDLAQAGGPEAILYSERRHDRISELAAYGQLSLQIAPNLVLSGGGRLFGSWLKTDSTVTQPQIGAQSKLSGNLTSGGFAPQVVLRYRPTEDMTLYVQASEGYRSGGFNTAGLVDQVFSAGITGAQPWRRYGGDELWNFEAGAKFRLLQGVVRVRAAGFYMLWRNIQSDQLLVNGLPYTANVGDGRDVGWEGDIDIQPDDHWRLRLNLAVAKPEVTNPNPSFIATPKFGLSGSWNYWASLLASYDRSLNRSTRIRLVASCGYVGGANLTLDAVTAAEDSTNVATAQLRAEIVHRNWTAAVFLRGLITGGSDTFGFGNPFSFRVIDQTTPARPTTIGVNLNVSLP